MTIRIDTEQRHVYVMSPLPVSLFESGSWFMRLVFGVCGEGAVMNAKLSQQVPGCSIAFSPPSRA